MQKNIQVGFQAIKKAERSQLVDTYTYYTDIGNEWIRRQVIENNRIDILAKAVLGYEVLPFHLKMLQWQFDHPESMQMVFRGAGKSTLCSIAKIIHYLLINPDLRILIASKTSTHAETLLKEIKSHFEENEKLKEIFGRYWSRNVNKWDAKEIEVLPRKLVAKEASVTSIGVGGMVVGKHYDIVISDDLIDEENSRIKTQREKILTWYYKVLDPTLEPPDSDVKFRGEHHRLGTRYHYDDLYGHLEANEMKEHTNVIPSLNEKGQSPWPEKFPPEWFDEKRKKSGLIIFNSQYQCDTEAMKGEIFQYDDCQIIPDDKIPKKLKIFMGIDLAISEADQNDKFAIVVIGVDSDKKYYVLDYHEGRHRFGKQTEKILQYYKRWKPIRAGIEINAYQKAQYHNLRDSINEEEHGINGEDLRLRKITTDKDKITRAWKLSAIFEDKRIFFKENQHLLIEHLVLFPNYPLKDLFDALDMAVSTSKMKKRRKRREYQPGLI